MSNPLQMLQVTTQSGIYQYMGITFDLTQVSTDGALQDRIAQALDIGLLASISGGNGGFRTIVSGLMGISSTPSVKFFSSLPQFETLIGSQIDSPLATSGAAQSNMIWINTTGPMGGPPQFENLIGTVWHELIHTIGINHISEGTNGAAPYLPGPFLDIVHGTKADMTTLPNSLFDPLSQTTVPVRPSVWYDDSEYFPLRNNGQQILLTQEVDFGVFNISVSNSQLVLGQEAQKDGGIPHEIIVGNFNNIYTTSVSNFISVTGSYNTIGGGSESTSVSLDASSAANAVISGDGASSVTTVNSSAPATVVIGSSGALTFNQTVDPNSGAAYQVHLIGGSGALTATLMSDGATVVTGPGLANIDIIGAGGVVATGSGTANITSSGDGGTFVQADPTGTANFNVSGAGDIVYGGDTVTASGNGAEVLPGGAIPASVFTVFDNSLSPWVSGTSTTAAVAAVVSAAALGSGAPVDANGSLTAVPGTPDPARTRTVNFGGYGGTVDIGNQASLTTVNGSDDTIKGGAQSDTVIIASGSGNDIVSSAGNNTYIDDVGLSTLDYTNASNPVSVDLASGVASNGFGATDTLTGIQRVAAAGNGNAFTTGAGSDTITVAGNDTVFTYGAGSILGSATINQTATTGISGVLQFGALLHQQDVWLSQSGNDLLIQIVGTTDQMTIAGWYAADSHKLAEFTFANGTAAADAAEIAQIAEADAAYQASNPSFNPQTAATSPLAWSPTAAGPDPLFDPVYYLAHNPDVAAAGVDPYAHYLSHGWLEGRNPSALFDTSYYLAQNPDVAAAGVNPLLHYETFGWKEGRNPSSHFSTVAYLNGNPDVRASGVDPLVEYAQDGQAEGRATYSVKAPGQNFDFTDTTAITSGSVSGDPYSGPVAYLKQQYIWPSTDTVAISASIPNVFLKGGPGGDALQVAGGSNVLDGGGGSNFLVGGNGADHGTDTFFVDGRGGGEAWSTIVNFHKGDMATISGFQQGVSTLPWTASDGAAGYTGATIHSELNGAGTGVTAPMTFANISLATAETFQVTYGSVQGNAYALFTYT